MFREKKKSSFDLRRDPDYIPQAHRNPKTPVHAKVYEANRARATEKRRKEDEKAENERKKQFVANGSGHRNLFDFVFVDNSKHQKAYKSGFEDETLDTLNTSGETFDTLGEDSPSKSEDNEQDDTT